MLTIRKVSPPPYQDIALLLQDSFAERLREGLNFSCAIYNEEDVKRSFSKATAIIGAYEESELIGIVMLNQVASKFGLRYATHENLAVASKSKGLGVASKMFLELCVTAKDNNLDFVLSDTAEGATSSVKYHLRNGFRLYGKRHFPGRNYNSVTFILPISWKGKLLSSWLGLKILRRFYANK